MKKLLLTFATGALLLGATTANAENKAPIEAASANSQYAATTKMGPEGAQWTLTNAAFVSIDGINAPTLNGKTSAVGTITSPTLTDGINQLSFKYANTFSESKGVSLRIDIKKGDEVVATQTLTNSTVTQNSIYNFVSKDFNIEGDFVIFITNLSPSNSTSNKDRVSIWDLEWSNYGENVLLPNGICVLDESYSVVLGESFENPVENPHDFELSWSSSNPDVAEVSDGVFDIKSVGTTEITASFAGDDTYKEGSVSFTLKVLDPNSLEASGKTINLNKMSEFSSWTSSYSEHTWTNEENGFVVTLSAAAKQTGTITDIPVIKASDIILQLTSNLSLKEVMFEFCQWTTKTQTANIYYGTVQEDESISWTQIGSAVTLDANNLSISTGELPNNIKYVKATTTNTSNQIGVSSIVYTTYPDVADGVSTISAENEGEAVFFDLTGRRISEPVKGMFIRVQGGKATKVVK